VADIAALGVRRISVGGALARAAWGGFLRAARLLSSEGRFDGFADAAPGKDLNGFFVDDLKQRRQPDVSRTRAACGPARPHPAARSCRARWRR
jgi:hypothetical protein